ncbi:MAG: ATP-binding protein [Candidatus Helarchaeota archaeon]
MEYLERELFDEVKKWIHRKEIIAIKGPRQSGKTTLLEMLKKFLIDEKKIDSEHIIFLTFEDRENLEKFEENPKEFIKSFIENNNNYYFLLDEVHYINEIGQKLKLLYDLFKNIKFIITGSSSLELTSATAKFLVGRLFSFELLPFNFYEFLLARSKRMAKIYKERNFSVRELLTKNKNFQLEKDIFLHDLLKLFDEFLIFGGYPEVIKAKTEEEKIMVLKGIYSTYIERDIISFLRIDETIKFKKLVTLLSSLIGKLIKYENLTASCDSYYKEIIKWTNILEQTYVIRTIRPFHRNLVTELRKNPKIYFVDYGLRNYSIKNFSPLSIRVDRGELAENFVFNQLLYVSADINFWRTTSKAEVDFILAGKIPIEVKFESMKREKISRSLHSFIKTYSPKFAIIVTKDFLGEKKVKDTIVKFIPIVYF